MSALRPLWGASNSMTTNHTIRKIGTACAALFTLAMNACVVAPYDNQWVSPNSIDFSGYAENPSATIRIQIKEKRTGAWLTIPGGTLTSSSRGTTLDGGQTYLHSWAVNDLDTSMPGHCVWGDPNTTNCVLQPGSASAQFRVIEVGGSLSGGLVTFDQNGATCVVEDLNAGDTWLNAGWNCRDAQSPVLTLLTLT